MNYLTKIAGTHFRKNPDGSVVFHPWGFIGRGYVLTDPERAARLLAFVRLYFLTILALMVGTGMVFRYRGLGVVAVLGVLLLPGYMVGIRLILAGAPRSVDERSAQERYAARAAGMSEKDLREGLMAAVVFVVGGILLLILARSLQDRLIGAITAVAATAVAVVHRRMLRSKRSQ